MKKNVLAWVMGIVLLMTGCSASKGYSQSPETLNVTVTTSFLQDMVHELAGPYVKVQLIIPAGEDPHTYEAKAEDNKKLKNADLVLYHGLHFEGKMTELLEAMDAKAVTRHFSKSDVRSMRQDGSVVTDPHFWFDIRLYKKATREAAGQLEKKLPAHKKQIEKNLKTYMRKLDDLDAYIRKQVNRIPEHRRILITPHDAFNYFSKRYGIKVRAPQGVSTDAELSNSDMAETADYIVEHKVKAIFAESTTDPARMKKLQESCAAKGWHVKVISGKGKELFSDSLAAHGQKGDTYLTMVRANIDLIVTNLR